MIPSKGDILNYTSIYDGKVFIPLHDDCTIPCVFRVLDTYYPWHWVNMLGPKYTFHIYGKYGKQIRDTFDPSTWTSTILTPTGTYTVAIDPVYYVDYFDHDMTSGRSISISFDLERTPSLVWPAWIGI